MAAYSKRGRLAVEAKFVSFACARRRALLCLHLRLRTSGARRKWRAVRPRRSCTRRCYPLCAWTTLQRRVLTSRCISFRRTTRTRSRPPRRSLPPSRSRTRTLRCSGPSSRALSCVSTRCPLRRAQAAVRPEAQPRSCARDTRSRVHTRARHAHERHLERAHAFGRVPPGSSPAARAHPAHARTAHRTVHVALYDDIHTVVAQVLDSALGACKARGRRMNQRCCHLART
jgi:hypothetical protein